MFHDIPQPILERMATLEAQDARDRQDGTPRSQRLRQVPPETGRMLAFLALSAPAGAVLEVGASAGYSALWLALACRQRGDRLTTFEVLPEKVRLAQETFAAAGVQDVVELIHADARQHLAETRPVAFCFLDAEKEIYQQCYDLLIPNLAPGGLLVADNVLSHQESLQPFVAHALADRRADALVAPVGKGLLICRKISSHRR
jgi:predicted O-methyltransferase YrrM